MLSRIITIFALIFLASCDGHIDQSTIPTQEEVQLCGEIPQELEEWPVDALGCPVCRDSSLVKCCQQADYFCRCMETTIWSWGKFFCPNFRQDR